MPNVEACSPADTCVILDRDCNLRGERVGGNGHGVAIRASNVSPLHGYKLANDPEEGDLEARSNANEHLGADERVHTMSRGCDDVSNETDDAADDEEPSAAEDVAQGSDDQEEHGLAEQVGLGSPSDIVRRAKLIVDGAK